MTQSIPHLRKVSAVVVALVTAMALTASLAFAESPPNPPSRFAGSVTVNGAPATAGTTIEARIGSATCGTTTVFMSGSEARYVLDSPALDPGASPNCGTDGATVTFLVGGQQANETGSWANYQLNTVNLTVGGGAVATPTASPSAPATNTAVPSTTPRAPVAGNSGSPLESGAPLMAALLLSAALGLGGVALASRVRK